MANRRGTTPQKGRTSREPPASETLADLHRAETSLRLVVERLRDYAISTGESSRALLAALDALDQHRMFLVPGVVPAPTVARSAGEKLPVEKLPVDALTRRQREILIQLAEGRSTKEVAAELGISSKTADAHRAQIMQKLSLRSQSELIFFAIRAGIVRLS